MMKKLSLKYFVNIKENIFIILTCGFFSLPSYALQTKTIQDNGIAYAAISIDGMTRIAVNNDRILDLRGPYGIYTLENDKNQGAVYLRLRKNPAIDNGDNLPIQAN